MSSSRRMTCSRVPLLPVIVTRRTCAGAPSGHARTRGRRANPGRSRADRSARRDSRARRTRRTRRSWPARCGSGRTGPAFALPQSFASAGVGTILLPGPGDAAEAGRTGPRRRVTTSVSAWGVAPGRVVKSSDPHVAVAVVVVPGLELLAVLGERLVLQLAAAEEALAMGLHHLAQPGGGERASRPRTRSR